MPPQSNNRPQYSPPKGCRDVVYWVTRDSDVEGNLSDHVDVWTARPTRRALTVTHGAYWIAEDRPDESDALAAHYGHYSAKVIQEGWKHTIPETDRECIRCETVFTEKP